MQKRSVIKEGDKFGKLIVVCEVEPNRWGERHVYRKFRCICECGNTRDIVLSNLRKAKSCGCISKEALRLHNEFTKTELVCGLKFGRLSFISEDAYSKKGRKAFFECECGTVKSYFVQAVVSGRTKSCGCYREEVAGNQRRTHGMKGSRTYEAWMSMKARCDPKNAKSRKRYAGRGIKVCDRWAVFENFLEDMGVRPDKTTLHRQDNDGDYNPSNCIWADSHTQNNCKNNTRYVTLDGVTKPIMTWCKDLGMKKSTFVYRLKKWGCDYEKITKKLFSL